jgi:hypothetical protein
VHRFEGDVGREQEELDRDQLLGAPRSRARSKRQPVKRHTMTRLAKPSIAESSPNEIERPAQILRPLFGERAAQVAFAGLVDAGQRPL